MLTVTGYQSGEVQSAETIAGIMFIMTILPMTLLLASSLLLWWYPIDKHLHGRIVDEVDGRRAQLAAG